MDDIEITANDTQNCRQMDEEKLPEPIPRENGSGLNLWKTTAEPIRSTMKNAEILPIKSVKYLGVTVDEKMNISEHIRRMTERRIEWPRTCRELCQTLADQSPSK